VPVFRINKDVEYALLALRTMDQERRVFSARELADRLTIPPGILSKILQRLSHAELLVSVQGPRGGYRLDRSADDITIGSVIDAVHGRERIVACMEEPGTCDQVDVCTIRHSFETMQGMWLGFLNSLTLRRFHEIDGGKQAAGAASMQ
jgi:Rrf2 family protein